MKIENTPIETLKSYSRNTRIHSPKQIELLARSIKAFGFNNPVLIDKDNFILAGHGRVLAATKLNLKTVPTVKIEHLSPLELKAFRIADNRIAEQSCWNKEALKLEFQDLILYQNEMDINVTGFSTPDIDLLYLPEINTPHEEALDLSSNIPKRVKPGELWSLGKHLLFCGNALEPASYRELLGNKKADMVFTDAPFNVKTDGHICGNGKYKHKDFAMAHGEMSSQEFTHFLSQTFKNLIQFSKDGSLHFVCMDWRHIAEITTAGKVYSALKNICVWDKQCGGMGSLYRSQHEFFFLFKNGNASHINNIDLGKYGRNRTNVWSYPGVRVSNPVNRNDLKFHPTVKPVGMIADAILDVSNIGDIVLDCFAGSGSTLLACERTNRKGYMIEIDPHYCDVILYRFEQLTGQKAKFKEVLV